MKGHWISCICNQFSINIRRVGIVEGKLGALEPTMNSMVQEIRRLSLKFDDRNLTDGVYRRGHERSSNNLPPPSGNSHPQHLSQQFSFQRSPLHQQLRQPSPAPRRLLWQLPYKNLTDEEELINTCYPEDDFEDKCNDGRTAYGWGPRRMVNPNPNKGQRFSFPNLNRRRGDPTLTSIWWRSRFLLSVGILTSSPF